MPANAIRLDVVIFGGGAAGLWLLDVVRRAGHQAVLLEADELGRGQTVGSQGIIHGGLKYTLGGLLTPSARVIRAMPLRWRRCLAGEEKPDLGGTRRRAEYCHLWQTKALSSRMAMIGARAGLHVAPVRLDRAAWPAPLAHCPGVVARVDEQVIDPASFLGLLLDRHGDAILRIDIESGLELVAPAPGRVDLIRLLNPGTGEPLDLAPCVTVLTAGSGNEDLRRLTGLASDSMQRRPLHMVVARGPLPVLNGHCVDGMQTRATITTAHDYADRIVWQIGGQLAETGVGVEPREQIERARIELGEILPGLDLGGAQWTTYRVDRAEGTIRGGRRPAGEVIRHEDRTVTAWPTKLALVPRLAERIHALLPEPAGYPALDRDMLQDWPRPDVASPPWEENVRWFSDASAEPVS